MKFVKQCGILVLFLTITFLFACSGGGGSSGVETGTVSVALTDSSCGSYAAIYVTIDEVQVNKNNSSENGNSGWRNVATPMKTYNLLKLINGVTEVLGDNELEAGPYNQIRLIIGKTPESENNINGLPHPSANYVLFDDGSDEPLKIPSGYNTGIKLVHNFEVEENSFVELLLDFEACKSVVETGSGKYILKPVIKVIEPLNKTEVYGKVTDSDTGAAIAHASVSAQISDGQSASIARSTVTSNVEGEEGEYSLLLSSDQTYHVVVYSDEEVDDNGEQKLYSPTCEQITEPKQDFEQNFSLAKSSIGTISGDVTVSGDIDTNDPPVVYISFFSLLPQPCDAYVEVTYLVMSPDAYGNCSYSINLPYGIYDVVASSQGYIPDTAPDITLNSSQTSVVDVDLDL